MMDDWANVDLSSICKQTLYTMDKYSEKDQDMIISCECKFVFTWYQVSVSVEYLTWYSSAF